MSAQRQAEAASQVHDSRAKGDDEEISLRELFHTLRARWKLLVFVPLLVGLAALAVTTFLIAPTFTAKTTFLPPQQQQSAATAMLASLGPLAGMAGGAAGLRTPADQFVALMQSNRISDQIINRFDLMKVYEREFRMDARSDLAGNVRMNVGKKDGLISVEVDDKIPQRAADIANRYVDELRATTAVIAVSEAQQRRQFFEAQLAQTKDRLVKAQLQLQASGFSQGALRAEPKAAADAYARLRAEITSAEVRLQTLRGGLAETAPEVVQQHETLVALKNQLARLEVAAAPGSGPNESDYIGKYREFKYQETLFDLYAKQFELARIDESREGALFQVIDPAAPPERKSKPKRALISLIATLATALSLSVWLLVMRSESPKT